MISLEGRQFGRPKVRSHELPGIERDQIVLPGGVLERVERHTVGFTRHAERLRAAARHLRRGCSARMTCGPKTAKEPGAGYILDAARGSHRS